MDPKKAEMKNVGSKLSEETVEHSNKDMSKELENLNKITGGKESQPIIKIKESDIILLKNELDITYEEAKNKKFAGGTTLYYFKEMGRKTAADYLLENEKPVLIMQGGKDFQVLADDDYLKFKELLSDRRNTFFKLYPELNHIFVDAIYDDIGKVTKEYRTERHIGEEVTGDIADFIKSQ